MKQPLSFSLGIVIDRGEMRAILRRDGKATPEKPLSPAATRHLLALTDFLEEREPRQVHREMRDHWVAIAALIAEHGNVTGDMLADAVDVDPMYARAVLNRFLRDDRLRLVHKGVRGAGKNRYALAERPVAWAEGAE